MKMLSDKPNNRPTAAYVAEQLDRLHTIQVLREKKKQAKQLSNAHKLTNPRYNSALGIGAFSIKHRKISFMLRKSYSFSCFQEAPLSHFAQERFNRLQEGQKKKDKTQILMVCL